MKTKEERTNFYIEKKMTTCLHFRGIQNDPCSAGVSISGFAGKIPCIYVNELSTLCEKRTLPSREDAVKMVQEDEASTAKHMQAFAAAQKDAKAKGLGQGSGGRSEMPCPMNCGGTLHYSVSSVNGHMHARCNSQGCVVWME